MKIYRGYDQTDLDQQYNNQCTVPDYTVYVQRYERMSVKARARLACELDIAYGTSADELMDLYLAPADNAPVQVFIHGGGWRQLSKDVSAFAAEAFVAAGVMFVAVGVSLVPAVKLESLVTQVRKSVAWLFTNVSRFGGDPHRIRVCGHSSGAHLASMLMSDNWQDEFGVPDDVVKSGLLVSGLCDLEPVRLSYRNEHLRLDRLAVRRNSLLYNLPKSGIPLTVAYGQHETDEFKRQSQMLSEAWQNAGNSCASLQIDGRNHFDVILELAGQNGVLAQLALSLIRNSVR